MAERHQAGSEGSAGKQDPSGRGGVVLFLLSQHGNHSKHRVSDRLTQGCPLFACQFLTNTIGVFADRNVLGPASGYDRNIRVPSVSKLRVHLATAKYHATSALLL